MRCPAAVGCRLPTTASCGWRSRAQSPSTNSASGASVTARRAGRDSRHRCRSAVVRRRWPATARSCSTLGCSREGEVAHRLLAESQRAQGRRRLRARAPPHRDIPPAPYARAGDRERGARSRQSQASSSAFRSCITGSVNAKGPLEAGPIWCVCYKTVSIRAYAPDPRLANWNSGFHVPGRS